MPQGRIVGAFVSDNATLIQIGLGTNDGIERGWRGKLVFEGGSNDDAHFVLIRVSERTAVAKVKVSIDVVKRAAYVALEPP